MSAKAKDDLYNLMSDLSEDGYKAGWMGDLEHYLWKITLSGKSENYGQTTIDEKTIERLKELSKKSDGWWIYDEEDGRHRFVKLDEWKKIYSPEKSSYRLAEVYDDIVGAHQAKNNVYFVFDGECPICKHAAHALRIKEKLGDLVLVNARVQKDHPLLAVLASKKLDLDEGMVIFYKQKIFHGREALRFMSFHGSPQNPFNVFMKLFFLSNTIAHVTYPWMRGTRNWLLRRKKVGRIDNLNLHEEPIFKSIFGAAWDDLPPVMKKHYANRPYSDDVSVVEGTLDVMCKPPLLLLAPIMKAMGQIPCVNATDVPVTVRFESDQNTKAFHFVRTFHFQGKRPYVFHSRMVQVKGDEVVEIMRFGLGWKMRYGWDGAKVTLTHRGYVLCAFGHFIPLPLGFLMGKGYAEERAVNENTFDMVTHITHPWWGKIYEYKGQFEVMG